MKWLLIIVTIYLTLLFAVTAIVTAQLEPRQSQLQVTTEPYTNVYEIQMSPSWYVQQAVGGRYWQGE